MKLSQKQIIELWKDFPIKERKRLITEKKTKGIPQNIIQEDLNEHQNRKFKKNIHI